MKTRQTMRNEQLWQMALLVNISIPVYFMLQEPKGQMLPGFTIMAAIALIHLLLALGKGKLLPLVITQFSLILLLGFLYEPMYLYLIFLMMYSFQTLPVRSLVAFAAIFAAAAAVMMLSSELVTNEQYWFNLLPAIFGGCVLPFIIQAAAGYRDMARRLQAATLQIERFAQQEERQRIAQELHDTLGHTLSLIVLKSEVAEKLSSRAPEKAVAEIRDIHHTASHGLKSMRELVSDMKIVRLAEEWEHARTLCAAANVQLEVMDGLESQHLQLTPLQESIIGMCCREAITNVVRHSEATFCRVTLEADREAIRCIIMDNGKGFSSSSELTSGTGNGVVGMKQRLALLEGQLHIHADRMNGTTLTMEIPIVQRQLQREGVSR